MVLFLQNDVTTCFCHNDDIIAPCVCQVYYSFPHFLFSFCVVDLCCDVDLGCQLVFTTWDSCQIRKSAGCACAWNAGNVFPATDFKGNCKLAIPTCITARAVMHVGIANQQWRGKRSRHFRCMSNMQFYVTRKRPMARRQRECSLLILCSTLHHEHDSMTSCKTALTSLLTHWSHCTLALSHPCNAICCDIYTH